VKKLYSVFLAILTCGSITALPVNNPIDASLFYDGVLWPGYDGCSNPWDACFCWCDAISVRTGFWGDYVFNRRMETTESAPNPASGGFQKGDTISRFSIYKNQWNITFNWCDWWDVWALVGAANFSQYAQILEVSGVRGPVNIQYSPATSYGVGSRMTVWECGCLGVGMEARYFGAKPKMDFYEYAIDGEIVYPNAVKASTYNEWQFAFGAALRLEGQDHSLVPYIALKFAGAGLEQNNSAYFGQSGGIAVDNLVQSNLTNQQTTGFAVGMTATSIGRGGITVEGRFADETAVFVNGQIRF